MRPLSEPGAVAALIAGSTGLVAVCWLLTVLMLRLVG
jgi:hypothetical protein